SKGLPAISAKKAGEDTKYGLTTAQAEEYAKFYGSNVDVLFDLAKKHKDEAKEYNMPLDGLNPLVYAMEYEMTA
ncbi:glycerol-3-phosphate dehydrogenase, partial [Bacillus paranthracis]|nr:glycerol-3-phosphate dehydrogenase [Bacillus paranthracis]